MLPPAVEYSNTYPGLEKPRETRIYVILWTGLWLRLLLAISILHFSFAVAIRPHVGYTNKVGSLETFKSWF